MREVVLDTETTGLDPAAGHKIVEIGCVELINQMPTGNTYRRLINPGRPMPTAAFAVHGLSDEILAQHPPFADIVDEFLAFIADAPLVIHNAAFDLGFVNAELAALGRALVPDDRAIDTLVLARRKFPGAPASLDALCRRFAVDASARGAHGALLDAELLARVYLELIGGRQPGLGLTAEATVSPASAAAVIRTRRAARLHPPTPEEEAAHRAFVATLTLPIWTS